MITTLHETVDDYNLSQRLKDINAILRRADTNVIERYAGISELALFKDVRKIEVLTVGLFDLNSQVRSLADEVLDRHYNLGETSHAVLALLDNEGEGLLNAFYYQEQSDFAALVDNLGRLLRRRRKDVKDDALVDHDRRHVLAILQGLGQWLRKLQVKLEISGPHPLKRLLEDKDHRKILPLIEQCLESEDIFCRRRAILVVGELCLNFNFEMDTFDLICQVINRPENRNEYNVTWDGLQALTAFVQQNTGRADDFYRIVRSFFTSRNYNIDDFEKRESQHYYTRLHCVEALAVLSVYEELKKLIAIGKQGKFLQMERADKLEKPSMLVKKAIIEALLKIYLRNDTHINDQQRGEILDTISEWVGSQDFFVREQAIGFFARLSNTPQALAYLLSSARANDARIVDESAKLAREDLTKIEQDNAHSQLEGLLTDRQQFVTVFGTLLDKEKIDDYELIGMHQDVIALLRVWCLQRIEGRNGKELERSRSARLEAMWILYDLTASTFNTSSVHESLTLAEIVTASREESPSFRSILSLFRARILDDSSGNQLHLIANSNDDVLVRVCAEIELLLQGKEKDISKLVVDSAPKLLSQREGIHISLASRFIDALALLETQNAADLVGKLLKSPQVPNTLRMQLRELLSDYHCYLQRYELLKMLLIDLTVRHRDSTRLRLDYIDLFRAGRHQQEREAKRREQYQLGPSLDTFDRLVLDALQDVGREFEEVELPLLFSREGRRVIALDSLAQQMMYTFLYSIDDMEAEKQVIKGYQRSQKFAARWMFLNRAITDAEIADEIREQIRNNAEPDKLSQHQTRFKEVRGSIVGRITRTDSSGVYVDVGIRKYQPFVTRTHLISQKSNTLSPEDWLLLRKKLEGTLLVFRVLSVTCDASSGVDEIVDLELSRSDFAVDALLATTGKTIQASVVGVRSGSAQGESPGVIFHADGRDFLVPLRELSWRNDPGWVKQGWRTGFQEKVGETLELTYNGNNWSIRDNQANLGNFVRLLYQKDVSQFDLVYAKQTEMGYVFETEPGNNCYIPSDRLIHEQPGDSQLAFLLPSRTIEQGDILNVGFVERDVVVKSDHVGQEDLVLREVVLNVFDTKKTPLSRDDLKEGAKIFGRLVGLDRTRQTAKIESSDPSLKEYSITIHELPINDPWAKIEEGSEATGRIASVDHYSLHIKLIFAMAMPGELRLGRDYPCKVINVYESSLQLSYANVVGFLREKMITYGHEPILSRYQKEQKLSARLAQEIEWEARSETITVKNQQVIADLGLEERKSISGDVVRFYQDKVTAEREGDAVTFEFTLHDFVFKGDKPRIYAGNKIELLRDSHKENELIFTIKSARVQFTILPDLDQRKGWRHVDDILLAGKEVECIYVDFRDGCFLFEELPGVVFALPLNRIEQADHDSEWHLTDKKEVQFSQPGGSNYKTYALYTGDRLTLFCRASGEPVQLRKYRYGLLHFFPAESQTSRDNGEVPIRLLGRVLSTSVKRESGKLVELTGAFMNNRKIALRSGIVGFYDAEKMTPQDEQRFKKDMFVGGEVTVMLDRPPILRGTDLWLTFRGVPLIETPKPVPVTVRAPIKEKLVEFKRLFDEGQKKAVYGKVERYERERHAFLVRLEDVLADYNPYTEYRCLLPDNLVSFNLVRSSKSLEAFSDEREKAFTIRSITVETAEIEVDLIHNPHLDIDEVGARRGWFGAKELRHATFLGTQSKKAATDEEEVSKQDLEAREDEQIEEGIEDVIGVEISPGMIIDIPLERFFIDGLPYSIFEGDHRLKYGDQMTLSIVKDGEYFGLDVVNMQSAEINLLTNSHRVIYGRVGGKVGNRWSLALQGYSRVACFLDPDYVVDSQKLAEYDLFRRIRHSADNSHELYFRPVQAADLKKGDIVRVTYQDIVGERADRLRVSFGKDRTGYIYRTEASYRPDFNFSELPMERGDTFDARVIKGVSETLVPMLSLKGVSTRRFSYFIDKKTTLKDRTFSTIVVRNSPVEKFIEVEVEPAAVVRIPYAKILMASGLNTTLEELKILTGDEIHFRLAPDQQNRVNLHLIGVLKSQSHYLNVDRLARVQFKQRDEKDGSWVFALPEHNNREGILDGRMTFFQGIFQSDLYLVVRSIPDNPQYAVLLRQRFINDQQLMARVESVDVDSILVRKEDGQTGYIYSRNATYRVNNRATYISQTLPFGKVIIVTRVRDNRNQLTNQLSLLLNDSIPFSLIWRGLRRRREENVELTYVRSEGDDRVFEFRPGELVIIPTSAIYFQDQLLRDFKRFLPGDVFTVKIESSPKGGQDEYWISVQNIELSLLHSWYFSQFIEAEVIEALPDARGIVVKAGPLEEFVSEDRLLPQHSANTFTKGSKIWLQVQIFRKDGYIRLEEVPRPSVKDLKDQVKRGGRRNLVTFGKIADWLRSGIKLNVLDEEVFISLPYLVWSDLDRQSSYTTEEVLPHREERQMLVQLTINMNEKLWANAKLPQLQQFQLLKVGDIVQAKVLNINPDSQGGVKSILLDVDGMRTLVTNDDLVCGNPADKACVEIGTWLNVKVLSINPEHQTFSVSGLAVSQALDKLGPRERFKAVVRYTLPHGLVFSYQGALGYIPNESIAWHHNTRAKDIFAPGDQIPVYKLSIDNRFPFSMKQRTQLEGLSIGEELEAVIHRHSAEGTYVWVGEILGFVPRYKAGFEQLKKHIAKDTIILQLDSVEMQSLVATFRPKQTEAETHQELITASEGVIRETLDTQYMTFVRQFQNILPKEVILRQLQQQDAAANGINRATGPLEISIANEDPAEQRFIKLLKDSKIPCTYRNIRLLLEWLWSDASFTALWKYLAQYQVPLEDDQDRIVHVLCQVARELSGLKMTEGNAATVAQCRYAVGITVLLPRPSEDIKPLYALRHLLDAYRHDKALDTQVALLILYDKLGLFNLRRTLLHSIVNHLSRNLGLLLQLPAPVIIDVIPRSSKIQMFMSNRDSNLSDINKNIELIRNEPHRIKEAEIYLRNTWEKMQALKLEIPEIGINLALCRAIQGDFVRALEFLSLIKGNLGKDVLPQVRSAFYQLEMYIYFHLGSFSQLQDLLTEVYMYDDRPWVQTWLGYMFFAAGNFQLSKAVIARQKSSKLLRPEHLLLQLYWLDHNQERPASFKEMQILQESFFLYNTTWEQTTLDLYLFPDPQNMEFIEQASNAQIYDVPDYVLYRYDKEPSLQTWLGSWKVARSLTDLSLRKADFEMASKILNTHFRMKRTKEAAVSVVKLYQELNLLNERRHFINDNYSVGWSNVPESRELSLVRREFIEKWMKSASDREGIGRKLVILQKSCPELFDLYWSYQHLRDQLWEALDLCMDYGSLVELLNEQKQLDQAALEDIVFHLLSIGLTDTASRLIQRAKIQDKSDSVNNYLDILEQLSQAEISGHKVLKYLLEKVSERSLPLYINVAERQAAVKALQILVRYPDATRQARSALLLGELLEIEKNSEEASQCYISVTAGAEEASDLDAAKFSAALHLLRLHTMHPEVSFPTGLPTVGAHWILNEHPLGSLLLSLTELTTATEAPEDCLKLAGVLGRLQLVVEANQQTKLDEIEALLYSLYQLPDSEKCIVPLYMTLVGTDALKARDMKDIWDILHLFEDYALTKPIRSELEGLIDQTIRATIRYYETKARPGRLEDTADLANLRSYLETLLSLRTFLLHQQLIDAPQQVEASAKSVMRFVSEEVQGNSLSFYLFKETAQNVVKELGLNNMHYGQATRKLLSRVFRQDGLWENVYELATNLYRPDEENEHDALLMELVFDRLVHNDLETVKDIGKKFGRAVKRSEVDRLVRGWEMLDQPIGNTVDFITHVQEIINFLKQENQEKLVYRYFQLVRENIDRALIPDDLWYQYLESAIMTDVQPEACIAIVANISKNLESHKPILTVSQLIHYVCHHMRSNRNALSKLIVDIVNGDLCYNKKEIVNELALLKLL